MSLKNEMHMRHFILLCLALNTVALSTAGARSLTPPNEPKDDSFYICYEKRCPNKVMPQVPSVPKNCFGACIVNAVTHTILPTYVSYKYIGCIISRLPCHLYTGDKFHARPEHLRQFQWMDTYPKALNSFYRCAYS